jgi:hypothetical protein
MSLIILIELVENLNKFVLQKEVIMTKEEHNDEVLVDAKQSITYISDNFLRFELIFSAIIALLINCKQIYNRLLIDY